MNNIESNICQAIDIIVQRAIAQAGYDKTIQATVVECVDATIGKYKVKYQDSTFYAYSGSSEVTYTANTAVYVLVPSGDMSKDKTILDSVSKLGTNYVIANQEIDKYDVIGENCINDNSTEFKLSSYYPGGYVKVLYSKDPQVTNSISINVNSLEQYIKNSQYMLCAAQFRTALPAEQQSNGNYGLLFRLDFLDSSGREVTREYVVDINKMQGNPYRLLTKTRQYGIFSIDGASFLRINDISVFCYDFPHQREGEPEDIFVSDIELCAVEQISEEDLNGYGLSFITPKGTYFDQTHLNTDTLIVKAQVKVKGNVVNTNEQDVSFYWFIEDVSVNNQSERYNQYGGPGWRCLNEFNVISSDSGQAVQWLSATDTLTITKQTLYAEKTTFKCVAIYDENSISKTIVISRLDAQWHITISSNKGTQFYFDTGYPTLTCYVNGESKPDDYTYCWAVISNGNDFNTIAQTTELNQRLDELIKRRNELLAALNTESAQVAASQNTLNQLTKDVEQYEQIQRVDRNVIYSFEVRSITVFCDIKCTVYTKDGICLGTGTITLKNDLNAEGVWNLIMHDGSQVYKYNEYGISPAELSNIDNFIIKNLTFTLYDNLGNAIDEQDIAADGIQWIMPLNNTMLVPVLEENYQDTEDGVRIYTGVRSLPYKIASSYNINSQDNDILLQVDYKGMRLVAKTNLVFTKEGEAGTNGSDYYCRIVPNINDSELFLEAPMITYNTQTGLYSYNFNPLNRATPFKVQLWHNSTRIFSDTKGGATSSEGKEVTVEWSILKNSYGASREDETSFIVNAGTGEITCGNFNAEMPSNILKVTLTHNGVTYYSTLPIITAVVQNSNYVVSLVPKTGFNSVVYSSDGRQPTYDTSYPFEVKMSQWIDGYLEDVSLKTKTYAVDYTWSVCGSLIERVNGADQIVKHENLIVYESSLEENATNKNQKAYRAIDIFDGQCVNNAINCKISRGNTVLARIHMPVHMMLNRYGNSAINGWDGNSVNIDNDGGVILSPQMGAGQKENDNSFTGVVMGKVRNGTESPEVGLFGYYFGQRSIFLDAQSGKAEFGIDGGSRIILDPSSNKAQIYSGNYDTVKKTGMMIDFSTPEIKFGSENFSVDKDGRLTAKGEGSSIAGWHFDNDSLYSMDSYGFSVYRKGAPSNSAYPPANYQYQYYLDNTNNLVYYSNGSAWTLVDSSTLSYSKDDSSNTRLSNIPFERDINGDDVKDNRFAVGDTFSVTQDGYVRMSQASIGDGYDKIYVGHSGPYNAGSGVQYYNSALYSGEKNTLLADADGFYLGTDGFSLGGLNEIKTSSGSVYVSDFQVTSDGNLFARGQIWAESGFIGDTSQGWVIDSDSLWNGKSEYTNTTTPGVYLGTDAIAFGSGNGYAYFGEDGDFKLANGRIAFDGDKLTIQNIELNWNNTYTSDGVTLSQQFQITADSVKSTVAQSQSKYDESGVEITLYGFGLPHTIYQASSYNGKKYLDQSSGYVYTSNGSTWVRSASPLPLITENLSSSIKQTATMIKSTVAQSQSKYNTSGYTINIYGYDTPNVSEYPPSLYNGQYFLDQKSGYVYRSNGSAWQRQNSSPLPLITDQLASSIKQTANSIKMTVAGAQSKYKTDGYNINISDYGAPNTLDYPPASYNGQYYLDQTTGYLYRSNGSAWQVQNGGVPLPLISEDLKSMIKMTEKNITLKLTGSEKMYDTEKLLGKNVQIDIYTKGNPPDTSVYAPSSFNGKYYLDQDTGLVYRSTGSAWTYVGTAEKIADDYRTAIKLNKGSISQKVSVGDVVAKLNLEVDGVTGKSMIKINGDYLRINTDNFKIGDNNKVTVGGVIRADEFVYNGTYGKITMGNEGLIDISSKGPYDEYNGGIVVRDKTSSKFTVRLDHVGLHFAENTDLYYDSIDNYLIFSRKLMVNKHEDDLNGISGQNSTTLTWNNLTFKETYTDTESGGFVSNTASITMNKKGVLVANPSISNASDARLKKDISDTKVNNALQQILKIPHKEFTWKKNNSYVDIGYIAQDLEKINPRMIVKPSEDEEDGIYAVDSYYLLGVVTKAIQELYAEIQELKGDYNDGK